MSSMNDEDKEKPKAGNASNHDITTTNSETKLPVQSQEEEEPEKPVVFRYRWVVLSAYALAYFSWSLISSRQVILSSSYAHHYNISNTVTDKDGNLGVDSIIISANLVVLIGYVMASNTVDYFGPRAMNIGTLGLMIGSWIWYAAGNNFGYVYGASLVYSLSGPFVASSILVISNHFFGEDERALATGIGIFMGLIGAGLAFIIGPMYETAPRQVELRLKSCQIDKVDQSTIEAFNNAEVSLTDLPCNSTSYPDAFAAFCCYTEADLKSYDLHLAVFSTVIFFYTAFTVIDRPAKAPSFAAASLIHDHTKLSLRSVVTNKRFMVLNTGDFFLTAGPEVILATITRILPIEVAGYDFLMTAIALALAIPAVYFTARHLDTYANYFPFTFGAYVSVAILWLIACIGIQVSGFTGGLLFMIAGLISIVVYIVWSVSGYELKLEYCFQPHLNVEGSVVGMDRIMVNLSGVIFLLLIPPEKVGATNTMWISWGLILLGIVIIVIFLPDKTEYMRRKYDDGMRAKRKSTWQLVRKGKRSKSPKANVAKGRIADVEAPPSTVATSENLPSTHAAGSDSPRKSPKRLGNPNGRISFASNDSDRGRTVSVDLKRADDDDGLVYNKDARRSPSKESIVEDVPTITNN